MVKGQGRPRLAAEPAAGEQLGEYPDDACETRIGRAVHAALQAVVGVEKRWLRHRANDAAKRAAACAERNLCKSAPPDVRPGVKP